MILNPANKPHNSLLNIGAIMICSLICKNLEESARFSYTLDIWKKLAGGKDIFFNNSVYLSKKNASE